MTEPRLQSSDPEASLLRPILGPRPSRRQFLAALGVGLVGAACTKAAGPSPGGPSASAAPAGSIRALTAGAEQLSVIGTGADAAPMNPGKNRIGFDLITAQGRPLSGGAPQLWFAPDTTTPASGPFPAAWHPFTAYEKTGDRSPKTQLPGIYSVEVDFPRAGNWNVAVTADAGSTRLAGAGIIAVTGGKVVAQLGSKAVSTPTPVATTDAKIAEICTRTPVCHLHAVSLDAALGSGRPTVVCFATPLLCESQLCGPVVDEQILAAEAIGTERANFIHVEEFLPGKDLKPPPPTAENVAPAFKAWGFDSEPWVIVADADGVIRFRALGPVTAPEIEAAVTGLL